MTIPDSQHARHGHPCPSCREVQSTSGYPKRRPSINYFLLLIIILSSCPVIPGQSIPDEDGLEDVPSDLDIPDRPQSSSPTDGTDFNGFSGGLISLDGATTPLTNPFAIPSHSDPIRDPKKREVTPTLPTVTVRGFLNFRTTVDGTVIVFTPSASPTPPTTSVYFGEVSTTNPGPFSYSSVVRPTEATFRTYNHHPSLIDPSPTSRVTVYPTAIQAEPKETTTTFHQVIFPSGTIKDRSQVTSSFTRTLRRPFVPPSTTPTTPDEVSRFARQEEKVTSAESDLNDSARVKLRRPGQASRPPGRFTWNRPASERPRLNRFKVKLDGPKATTPTGSDPTSRTGRDESDKEAAKLLNQRLNRRLGATRGGHLSTNRRSPDKDISSEAADLAPPNSGLMEGLLSEEDHPVGLPSHPLLPSRVVTEVQTFMSEVTRGFVDGQPLVDTVTLTTSIERTLDPTESDPFLGDSPSTLQPSVVMDGLIGDLHPTPVIVLTKSFTMTDTSSRTSTIVLEGIGNGQRPTTHTITDKFVIEKVITAYKTIPGMDNSQIIESLSADMNQPDYLESLSSAENDLDVMATSTANLLVLPTTLPDLMPSQNNPTFNAINANIGPQIDLNNPLVLGAALNNPALAAMYFGLQQLSQQATVFSTILKSTDVTSTETIFATKTVSFYDGRVTRTRTITEPASTTIRVIPTVTQDVQPVINPQVLVQQAQLQRAFASQLLNGQGTNQIVQSLPNTNFLAPSIPSNLFGPQQPPKATYLSETVTKATSATSTSTKVYTLIYNALSTKYRTVTSSSIFPTTVTEVVTKTITNPSPNFNFFG